MCEYIYIDLHYNNRLCTQYLTAYDLSKCTLTIDDEVKVLGLFSSCIHGTTLVAGLVTKTGTFYPQNLTSVADLQIRIAEKHWPRKRK